MRILSLDIGGAYTKGIYFEDHSISNFYIYFPIWKRLKELKSFLKHIKNKYKYDYIGITFTAELSDIFSNKKDGIRYLVNVCDEIFNNPLYLTYDKILIRSKDIHNPYLLSGANFVASVYYLEKKFNKGILIDMGSTTTDIIPFKRGKILYKRSDLERLLSKQLIYIGYLRTPLNVILNEIIFRGKPVRLSSEFFAITADLFNILGEIVEYSCETPDGKGKSKEESMQRIARLLCSDLGEITKEEIFYICRLMKDKIIEIVSDSIIHISREYNLDKAYPSGIGKNFLIEICKRIKFDYVDLEEETIAWNNLPCLGIVEMIIDGLFE